MSFRERMRVDPSNAKVKWRMFKYALSQLPWYIKRGYLSLWWRVFFT